MNNKVKPIHSSRIHWGTKMETVGDTLKKERIKQKKTLSQISLDTRIDVKKLKALEENNFTVFESPVSTKGFIRIYSEYLGLNSEKILAIYRRDFGEKVQKQESKTAKEEKNKFSWKYISLIIPLLILIFTLNYLYNQFSDFQNPPDLEIFEPKNNSTVNEDILTIEGRTDRDGIVEIGNLKVPVDENGKFLTKIPIEEGKNVITVKSISARNPARENVEILNITYEKIEEEIVEEEEEKIEEILLKVRVENSPTWIEIIVDDQMIVSQVLQVGYENEFQAKRNIQVNTGILQNTKVEINGEGKGLSPEDFSIRCEIFEENLECE